jgi:5-methylcytosine-specific restriction endonuclease McrA
MRCANRRARFVAALVEVVDPDVVFERDGWRCHLCGEGIDPTLSGRDRMGPTLDHVIPLAEGGEHSYANVAAAHRSCNSRKGASLAPSLALAG